MYKFFFIFILMVPTSFIFCDDDPIEEIGDEMRELLESIEDSDDVSENWHEEVREKVEKIQRSMQEILHSAFRERLENELEKLQDQLEVEKDNEEDTQKIRRKLQEIKAVLHGDRHRKLRNFIKEYLPEMVGILEKLQKENPEEFKETIENLYVDMTELEELKQENPEMFSLAIQAQRHSIRSEILAQRYKEKKDAETKTQLLESLNIIFDAKVAINKHEMQHLARELEEVKNRLTRKVANKSKIIQQRFEQITGQTEFDW